MPKRIPLEEMRKWLKAYEEEGRSIEEIAKEAGRDKRTVRSGIERLRHERAAAFAKAEIIKDALYKHQQQLLESIRSVIAALEVPPDNLDIELPIQLTQARVDYQRDKGLVLSLQLENTIQWELLKEHLKRDRTFSALNRWKVAVAEHMRSRRDMKRQIKYHIEQSTGLEVAKDADEAGKASYVAAMAIDEIFYPVIIRRILSIADGTNPEKRMVVDKEGNIRHGDGGTVIAYAPADAQKVKAALIEVFPELQNSSEAERVVETYQSMEEWIAKTRRKFGEIHLLNYVPGQCRVCRRVGV